LRCHRAAAAGGSQSPTAPSDQLALLAKLLRWPAAALFPALDLARLLALDAAFAPAIAQDAGSAASPGTLFCSARCCSPHRQFSPWFCLEHWIASFVTCK